MRRASITLLLTAFLAGSPAAAQDREPGKDFGLAGASAVANLVYTPPKLLTALIGLPLGAVTGLFTGLNERSMYAVWTPTMTGTYFLTPAHLEGKRPIEFLGSRYPKSLACGADPNTEWLRRRDTPCGPAAEPAREVREIPPPARTQDVKPLPRRGG
jgi:hypothetical protein